MLHSRYHSPLLRCVLYVLVGFFVPFYYIIDHAISTGTDDETSAYLLSIIGVVNIFARILCGFLADTSCGDPLLIYSAGLIVGGAATMSTSWLQTFPLLAGYAVVFGFCVGKAFQYTVRIMTPTDPICVLFSCLRVTDCDIVGRVSGSQQTVQLVRTDQHVSGHRHFHRSSSGRCPFKRQTVKP